MRNRNVRFEKILREFIRNATYYNHKMLRESAEDKSPHLEDAIKFILSNQSKLKNILDDIENPNIPGFGGKDEFGESMSYENLKEFLQGAAAIDARYADLPYCVILFSHAITSANYTNFSFMIGELGRLIDGIDMPYLQKEARGSAAGALVRGFSTNSSLADDAFTIVDDLLGGSALAAEKVLDKSFKTNMGAFTPRMRDSTGTLGPVASSSSMPLNKAVGESLKLTHIADPDSLKISDGLRSHMDANGRQYTVKDLNDQSAALESARAAEIAAHNRRSPGTPFDETSSIDPAGFSSKEAKAAAKELEARINKLVNSEESMFDIIRAVVKQGETLGGKVPVKFRGAYPSTIKTKATVAAGIAGIISAIDMMQKPTIEGVFDAVDSEMQGMATDISVLEDIVDEVYGDTATATALNNLRIASTSNGDIAGAVSELQNALAS